MVQLRMQKKWRQEGWVEKHGRMAPRMTFRTEECNIGSSRSPTTTAFSSHHWLRRAASSMERQNLALPQLVIFLRGVPLPASIAPSMPTRVIAVAMPWSTAKLMLCKLSCPCSQVFVLAMVALRPGLQARDTSSSKVFQVVQNSGQLAEMRGPQCGALGKNIHGGTHGFEAWCKCFMRTVYTDAKRSNVDSTHDLPNCMGICLLDMKCSQEILHPL
eukprot:1159633-Pelagomonas_calceolata.AAC.2